MAEGIVKAASGEPLKCLGGSAMSSFPLTLAAFDAARRLQRAVSDGAADPPIGICVGLQRCDVIQTMDGFLRDVADKPVGITGVAGPRELCMSGAARVLMAGHGAFAFGSPTIARLRALEDEDPAHRPEWRT